MNARANNRRLVAVRFVIAMMVAGVTLQAVRAQNASRGPEFAVAVIKPLEPGALRMTGISVFPDGRLLIRAATLNSLISTAFGVAFWQISGGAPWMQSEVYSVEAKPPEELQSRAVNRSVTWTGIEDETLKAMLRNLVADRFQLKIRREATKGTVYVLKQSGRPLKLRPSAKLDAKSVNEWTGTGTAGYAGGQWAIGRMSMKQFAEFASNYYLRAPVVDQTGLQGLFDYRQAEPDVDPVYGDQNASYLGFLRMIQDVGLQLEKTEGQVEALVIESAEKPSPN